MTSLVQTASTTWANGSQGSAKTITLPANATVGNVVVVAVSYSHDVISSVAGLGGTWSELQSREGSSGPFPSAEIWYVVVGSATTAITLTPNSGFSIDAGRAVAWEFSGLTGALLGSSTVSSQTSTATRAAPALSTAKNGLYVGVSTQNNGGTAPTGVTDAPSAFAANFDGANGADSYSTIGYRISTGSETDSRTANYASAAQGISVAAAFEPLPTALLSSGSTMTAVALTTTIIGGATNASSAHWGAVTAGRFTVNSDIWVDGCTIYTTPLDGGIPAGTLIGIATDWSGSSTIPWLANAALGSTVANGGNPATVTFSAPILLTAGTTYAITGGIDCGIYNAADALTGHVASNIGTRHDATYSTDSTIWKMPFLLSGSLAASAAPSSGSTLTPSALITDVATIALSSGSAMTASSAVVGSASLSSGSMLAASGVLGLSGQAPLSSGSTLAPIPAVTEVASAALHSYSLLLTAASSQTGSGAAMLSTSVLGSDGGTGQASIALLSISTLGAAGTTVRPAGVVLRSTSALGVAAGVPPTGAAVLHSVSALGALGTIAGQVTGLSATWTVTPLSISQDDTQSSNSLAGGNPATGGALTLRVVITAATLEQAVLADWLPGTITPGTLIDPGGPGVAPTYTDPVFIPEDFGIIVNPPGVPPAPVPLGSQFVPLKRVSEIYPVPTLDNRGRPIGWQPSNVVVTDIGWYQIVVANHDCTVLGNIPAQISSMVKHEPFGYVSATVAWPGVSGFQRIGVGAAAPLNLFKAGAAVEIRLINPIVSTTAYHTVFEGELSTLDDDNDNKTDAMSWTLIGVLFRADLQLEAPRIVPISTLDIGTAIPRLLNAVVNRTYAAVAKVVTNIPSYRRGSWQPILTGGVQDMLSTATTSDGLSQWTVMALPARKVVMRLKNTTTINWSVRYGQRGVVTRLRLDSTQFPTTIFGEGTDPKGLIWRNSKYPNLHIAAVPAYPLSPSQVFFPGSSTTGFLSLADFMRRHGYGTMVSQNTYASADEDEIRRFQQSAQILVDGIVGPQTWVAAFGIGTDAESLSGARIDPLVIDPHVELYTYGANGSITGKNPNHDPHALRVDRFEEFGEGIYKIDGIRSARAEYRRDHIPGYVGTIDLSVDPNEGSRRFIEPGQNILLQNHRGVNRKLHIAGVTITEAGSTPAVVSLDVSEKAMDRLTLAGILSRNKDNTDPARRRLLAQRTSRTFNDQIIAWDSESGAGIIPPFPLYGGLWTVVRIPAGGYATIVESLFHTRNVKSEFAVGVFSQKVTAAELSSIVGNPLRTTTTSASPWVNGSTALLKIGWVIGWGDADQPGGYSPASKGTGPLTGDLIDKGSWEFQSTSEPWMWLATYAAHSCIFSGQLRAAILQ